MLDSARPYVPPHIRSIRRSFVLGFAAFLAAVFVISSRKTAYFKTRRPNAVGWLNLNNDSGQDAWEDVINLKRLKQDLEERFIIDQNHIARSLNPDLIDNLIACISTSTCEGNQGKVVILASYHFGNARFGGTSGEDIWAKSTDEAITSLGYTVFYAYGALEALTIYQAIPHLVVRIIGEGSDVKHCSLRNSEFREVKGTMMDFDGWQNGRVGCARKEEYLDGIPLWLMHSFHWWPSVAHPLGAKFTLAIDDYKNADGIGLDNYYLGYSIEQKCRQIPTVPASQRLHQGLILGKNPVYLSNAESVFPNMLQSVARNVPRNGEEEFRFVAVAGKAGDELEEAGVENLGMLKQDEWHQVVAERKVLLGVGRPTESPSPYDSLCFGVPFINVITGWDVNFPDDKSRFYYQQTSLKDLKPPYVYTVKAGDQEGLEAAVKAAVSTPIDRYIVPAMSSAAIRERARVLLETDWKAMAEEVIMVDAEIARFVVENDVLL